MKYIIDTDPGIDDAIAIMLGYLNGLDIIGFTLATGNISKEKSADNLKTIQEILNSDIKMYYGTKDNGCDSMQAEYAHGKDGLGNVFMPKSLKRFENISAEDFIIEAANKYENDLTIVCLGPLTNLASALEKDPKLKNKLNHVVIMGTSYNPNEEIPYNEFNIKIDTEAAEKIFSANFSDIKIITHEIGVKSFIEKDYINSLKKSSNKISRFLYIISQKYMEFSYDHYGTIGLGTPDPTTIGSIIDPNIIKFTPCYVKIKNNLSYITLTNTSNIKVSTDINLNLFRELFKNTFK